MAALTAMPPDRSSPFRASRPGSDKRGFAKRALAFVKRAPGFPMLWIGSIAAWGIMTVTGGFGTAAMPIGQRTLFWLLLMTWSAIKWQLWFIATVRKPRDWLAAGLGGALLLSLLLPLEIEWCGRAVGIDEEGPALWGTWGRALAIGGVIAVAIALMMAATGKLFPRRAAAPDNGLLTRARVSAETLASIEAEDHYCRVRRADGTSALIHYRFGDALAEVAGLDGVQVHRGAWVAASAVTGAERDGRRWLLLLSDGTKVAVSATHLSEARARGWLRAP